MGCDIHTHFEFKRTYNNEKKWYCGDYFTLNHYFKEDDPEYGEKYELVQVFKERNYSIFATLANVRNYGDTPYISQPKGLPHDVTAETKRTQITGDAMDTRIHISHFENCSTSEIVLHRLSTEV